ncbi:hypothetical protein DFQ26_009028 [Actinomortierella ambigua]|nr:hypothetical protein DFQ26_009028 [Actinomortierella ambigua]
MQSYTIDFGCERTKAAFTDDEWKEMEELNDFQLPKLPDSTERYLLDVREALIKGQHVASVPVPSEDRYSCDLVLRSFLSWIHLYKSKPSPFGIKDLPKSFWSREGWPILKSLLGGVKGLMMIDGGKAEPREHARWNVDLVARDTTTDRDWLIVESLKKSDESSTEFPREDDVAPFKNLHFIASQRLQERPHARFRKEARFFSIYSGDLDFKTLEMRACPFSSRIMLFREYDWHELPATPRTWRRHVQGLAHLLQVRSCVTATVKMYDEILSKEEIDDDSGEERSGREWLYKPSTTRVYDDTLGSSPSGPSSSIFYS